MTPTLEQLNNPSTKFVNPDVTAKVISLVTELEALPGVSVAVLVLDDQGRAPMALGGNVKALAVHLMRMLPGLLQSVGLGVNDVASQPCDCPSCRARREKQVPGA